MNTRTQASSGAYTLAEEIDWEVVYKEYLPRAYNFFRYRVGDEALAEDLTAATFEKAWRGRTRFQRNLGAFSTWIFTIARNLGTDHFRRNRHDLSLETVREPADSTSLEETIQHKQDFAHLGFLLAQLATRERELVAFKYGAGLTNREIAQLAHLSESNVGTILHRVVEKLRIEMEVDHER